MPARARDDTTRHRAPESPRGQLGSRVPHYRATSATWPAYSHAHTSHPCFCPPRYTHTSRLLRAHLDGRCIKDVKPSPSSQTRILQHRDPDMLVVPAHQLRGHLQSTGCGIRLIHRLLDSPARSALADFHRHPELWRW